MTRLSLGDRDSNAGRAIHVAPYRGRFAPSPTGALHAGSLVAALASWLDARAHDGRWLIRIEDLDPPREVAGAAAAIVSTLAAFGLESDEPLLKQSERHTAYEQAFLKLHNCGALYGCACSRREVGAENTTRSVIYPGTCRLGTGGRPIRSWRLRVPPDEVSFDDRCCGLVRQRVDREVGDFIIRRADGLWAYQLAVVVDDAAQRITDVVRGADLLDSTPRQIVLQRLLGLPPVRYLHVPLVLNEHGEKLSKQTGAAELRTSDALAELERAWLHLGFARLGADSPAAFLARAVELWRERWAGADTIAAVRRAGS